MNLPVPSFGHIFEIHTEYASQERQRNKDRRNDRQFGIEKIYPNIPPEVERMPFRAILSSSAFGA